MYDYIMLHKPAGCITARRDERHKTVMDYLPEEMRDTHFPVGRLDKDTEGLLLITNDGKLTRKLLMPEHKIEKTYYFMAEGILNPERLDEVRRGARIYYNRENPTAPSEVEVLSNSKTVKNVIWHEVQVTYKKINYRGYVSSRYLKRV